MSEHFGHLSVEDVTRHIIKIEEYLAQERLLFPASKGVLLNPAISTKIFSAHHFRSECSIW